MSGSVIFPLILYVSVVTVIDLAVLRVSQSWLRRLAFVSILNSVFPLVCFAASERLLFGAVVEMLGIVCFALGPIALAGAVILRKVVAAGVPSS